MRFDPVECGKRIKALRENKNLTRAQLAEQLNISFDHMRMAERGTCRFIFDFRGVIRLSHLGQENKDRSC